MRKSFPRGLRPLENFYVRCGPRPVDRDACWLWQGAISVAGYGRIEERVLGKRRVTRAHRLSYHVHVGPIPDGAWVLHTCDVRACINPRHLYLGTVVENTRDRDVRGRNFNRLKTHCVHGHEFTPENTKTYKGKRMCKACDRERARDRYRRDPVAAAARRHANRLKHRAPTP